MRIPRKDPVWKYQSLIKLVIITSVRPQKVSMEVQIFIVQLDLNWYIISVGSDE